jgi:predicted phage tail protein
MNINESVYANAKSTRPAWANALIVAAVIFGAAIFVTVTSGAGSAFLLYAATGVALLIAGVLALTRIGNRGA